MTQSGQNDDFTQFVALRTSDIPWQPSPSPTVWRKRLDHVGGQAESGAVTSVVRYDADSAFAPHDHPDGEEILVLDGVFSDEHGDYPAGAYLLNPTGFRHAPFSKEGCVLLVKLCQYGGADRPRIAIDTNAAKWRPHAMDGAEYLPLYRSDAYPEYMRLLRFAPGTRFPHHTHDGGEEFFVLDGALEDESGRYEKGAWVRYPAGSVHRPYSDIGGTIYVKSGHLGVVAR